MDLGVTEQRSQPEVAGLSDIHVPSLVSQAIGRAPVLVSYQ